MDWTTHGVCNVVEAQGNFNRYDTDLALREGVMREGAAWADDALHEMGEALGRADLQEQARLANVHNPVLRSFDPQGRRVDSVDFHPAWHGLMRGIFQRGFHCAPWERPSPGAHVARAAGYLMQGQVEAGTLCPTTMTFASIPILRRERALWSQLEPHMLSREYDPSDAPLSAKMGMLVGMGLTEKQGGSDLRANTTRATPVAAGGRGEPYTIVGHKWFLSAPQSDAHLVLAQDETGALSCFYVARWLSDGARNAVRVQRLKDKLGNRSNASAEVEFQDALGVLIGEPGRGIPILMEMATYTRLDNVLGSSALLRAGVIAAVHHARGRAAFGQMLAEQPLMQAVLADLALESEAATALALRLAAAFDRAEGSPLEAAMRRILTPAAKLWVCKRTIEAVAECMEVLGGNGYVEEHALARLLREAPVNSIWEGSGNVMALDLLRAFQRESHSAQALLDWLASVCSGDSTLSRAMAALEALIAEAARDPSLGRSMAQELVLLVQAVLLRQHAPQAVADAFIVSRLGCARSGRIFGTLPQGVDARAITERAWSGD
jgi:putative acyl-CoA dehydrogenase